MSNIYQTKDESKLKQIVQSNNIVILGLVADVTPIKIKQYVKKFLKYNSQDVTNKKNNFMYVYFEIDSSNIENYGLSLIKNYTDVNYYPRILYIVDSSHIIIEFTDIDSSNTMRDILYSHNDFINIYNESINTPNDNSNNDNNTSNTNNTNNENNNSNNNNVNTVNTVIVNNENNVDNADNAEKPNTIGKYDMTDPKIQTRMNNEIRKRKIQKILEKKQELETSNYNELLSRIYHEKKINEENEDNESEYDEYSNNDTYNRDTVTRQNRKETRKHDVYG